MSKKRITGILKYGITAAVCVILGVLYLVGREYTLGTFWATAQAVLDGTADVEVRQELARYCSDALFVPGILAVLTGALLAVSNEGAFYGIGYALSVAAKALIPGGRNRMERYSEYRERKDGKKVVGFGFLFLVGGVFTVLGLILGAVYYGM